MSYIQYNGVGLSFVQTRRYIQEPIKLARDVAGTRHTLTVLAQVHFNTAGNARPPVAPAVLPEVIPVALDAITALRRVRDRLLAPRRAFVFAVGTVVLANLPVAPQVVDIELGPTPLACNVVQFNGEGTAQIEYTIQWAVPNPCPDMNGVMAVLAHAWAAEDDIDEDYFVTRTYRGRIIFDPRVVGPAGTLHPNAVKRLLLPPLVSGFHRVKVFSRCSEDGVTYDYVVVDRQPHAFCNSDHVTRITANHRLNTSTPAPKEWIDSWFGVGGQVAAQEGRFRNPAPTVRENVGGLAGTLQLTTGFMYAGIPVTTQAIEVTAYGTTTTEYIQLAAARVVALYRILKATTLDPGVLGARFGFSFWGGSWESEDSASPKSSTVRVTLNSRPRAIDAGDGVLGLFAVGANAAARWRLGDNTCRPSWAIVWWTGRSSARTVTRLPRRYGS